MVRTVVTFHSSNDYLSLGAVHKILHAPGFAISGVIIKEYIVAIKHVQHRIALVGVSFVRCRQIFGYYYERMMEWLHSISYRVMETKAKGRSLIEEYVI